VDQIIASTQHPLALDAFVSILFAPQARLSFDGMVAAMQCPVCMIYGREDPWVVPLWGQRLKRLLADAVYLEVKKLHQACHDHACIPTEMRQSANYPFPLQLDRDQKVPVYACAFVSNFVGYSVPCCYVIGSCSSQKRMSHAPSQQQICCQHD